jgi:hypothetical protein
LKQLPEAKGITGVHSGALLNLVKDQKSVIEVPLKVFDELSKIANSFEVNKST